MGSRDRGWGGGLQMAYPDGREQCHPNRAEVRRGEGQSSLREKMFDVYHWTHHDRP